ncbi:MAG: hypothetical protein M3T49_04455 [Candidatus Eremiobacteraeota bacterium]|nr:hypothetical protein [Candidatus Eremiobacteraeota bacterium]
MTARVGTIEVAVPKIAPGTFHMEVRVPHLPLFNGRMNIVFTAIRADGVRAERTVPIEVTD